MNKKFLRVEKKISFRGPLSSLTLKDALINYCNDSAFLSRSRDRGIDHAVNSPLIRSEIRAGRNLIRRDWWKPRRWYCDGGDFKHPL